MKAEVKCFEKGDVRDRVGRLDLRAENAVDAEIMALVYRCLFSVCTRAENPRLKLVKAMLEMVDDKERFEIYAAVKEMGGN